MRTTLSAIVFISLISVTAFLTGTTEAPSWQAKAERMQLTWHQWHQQIIENINSLVSPDPISFQQANKKGAATSKAGKKGKAAAKKPASKYPGQYPEGSERVLTEKDLQYLTPWGKSMMLNEIYARHGMTFRKGTIRNHFRKEKWYKGKHKSVDHMLTETERQNIAFINSFKKINH